MSRAPSELASRIARWRTGDASRTNESDETHISSGPSKFWWHDTSPPPVVSSSSPSKVHGNTAHARVNAVVEARTRRLARGGGVDCKTRVAVRVAERNLSSSTSAEIAANELARLSVNNPDLQEALSLIRRGPDGRVTVGSLRIAEATMRENYARSLRASAEIGEEDFAFGDTKATHKNQKQPGIPASARSSADYSGGAYMKVDDLFVSLAAEQAVPGQDRPTWDDSPGKHARRSGFVTQEKNAASRPRSAGSARASNETLGASEESVDLPDLEAVHEAQRDTEGDSQDTLADSQDTVGDSQDTVRDVTPEIEPEEEVEEEEPAEEDEVVEEVVEEETEEEDVVEEFAVDDPVEEERVSVDEAPSSLVPPSGQPKSTPTTPTKRAQARESSVARSPTQHIKKEEASPPRSPGVSSQARYVDIPPALLSPTPALPEALFKLDHSPASPPLPASARSPPEKTAALAAKHSAFLSGRDVDAAGLVSAGSGSGSVNRGAVRRAAERYVATSAAFSRDGFASEIASKAATTEIARAYERAVLEDRSSGVASGTGAYSASRKLDAWAMNVSQFGRDAEQASAVSAAETAAETAAKKALHEEWEAFSLTGVLPTDELLLGLARLKLAKDKETETLRSAVRLEKRNAETSCEKLRSARRAEAERKEMLRTLHAQAEAVAAKEAEIAEAQAKAEQIEKIVPPVARVVVPERDATTCRMDLSELRKRIESDLDESVNRVTRAVRGEPADGPVGKLPSAHPWHPTSVPTTVPTLPSHPYPIVASHVAPVYAQTVATAPVMTTQQTEQYNEQLRATRRLAERVGSASREGTPRQHYRFQYPRYREEPPSYEFPSSTPHDDGEGSVYGDAPTPQKSRETYAAVPTHWQSPPKPAAAPPPVTGTPKDSIQPSFDPAPVVAQQPRALPQNPPAPSSAAPPEWQPPTMPAPSFSFGPPRRVAITGLTPREYVSDDVEAAYAESLAQQRAVFGDRV